MLLNEKFSPWVYVGIVFVVFGVVLISLKRQLTVTFNLKLLHVPQSLLSELTVQFTIVAIKSYL